MLFTKNNFFDMSNKVNSCLKKAIIYEIEKLQWVFYLTSVNIPDELYGEIEKAVNNGACCSVNHWVKKP